MPSCQRYYKSIIKVSPISIPKMKLYEHDNLTEKEL